MAKVVSDHVVVTVSKIAHDSESDEQSLVPAEIKETLEALVAEIFKDFPNLIVEVK